MFSIQGLEEDNMSVVLDVKNLSMHYETLAGNVSAVKDISFSINKTPRTSREIASIFNLDNTSATKGCKNAINILNDLELKGEQEQVILTKTTPCSIIGR